MQTLTFDREQFAETVADAYQCHYVQNDTVINYPVILYDMDKQRFTWFGSNDPILPGEIVAFYLSSIHAYEYFHVDDGDDTRDYTIEEVVWDILFSEQWDYLWADIRKIVKLGVEDRQTA